MKEKTLKDLADAEVEENILGRNLDVSEEILTRAAKVAYEIIDGLTGNSLSAQDLLRYASVTGVYSVLVVEFVKILSSGR